VLTSLAVTSLTLEDVPPKACPDTPHSPHSLKRTASESITLMEAFKRADRDGDDRLSKDELASVFINCMERADLSRRFAEVFFEQIDANGDGTVSVEEFVEFVTTLRESPLQPQDFLASGSTPEIKVLDLGENVAGSAGHPRRSPSPRVRSARDEAIAHARTAALQPHHAHLRRGSAPSRSASPRPRSPAAAAR